MKFINKTGLIEQFENSFTTTITNATKFLNSQLMTSVVLASLCGVAKLSKFSIFTSDVLVRALLGLSKRVNKDVISTRFKMLGQKAARTLEELNGKRIHNQLEKAALKSIILDADSTVKTVYGHQQGAKVGYNPHKKGAASYHPLLLFASDVKLVVNSWFRTGAVYTSNGIVEFLKQAQGYLPAFEKVLFRADSGFFNGELFDWLEEKGWDYLIKVKLKGLKTLLAAQEWRLAEGYTDVWVCEFTWQCKEWTKSRTMKAIRSIKKYQAQTFFGQTEYVPIYKYACYCTTKSENEWAVHECYKQRSTSENWIDQVKNQLLAGMTLTDDFWANDILWQLCVLAYNLSVMMRLEHQNLFRQEQRTFRDWFILVPGEFVGTGRPKLRLYQYYLFKEQWKSFADSLVTENI